MAVITHPRDAVSQMLILSGLFLIGSFIASALSIMPLWAIYGGDMQELVNLFTYPQVMLQAHGRLILCYLQFCTSLGGFFLSTWFFLSYIEPANQQNINPQPRVAWQLYVIVPLLTVSLMPLTSLVVEWNAGLKFPAIFEQWARPQEEMRKVLTMFLTDFQNIYEIAFGFLVIAIMPAIGEELLFRGMLQRKLAQVMNLHAAVWTTGVLFSAIHFQFYGFVPRALLGVGFGYLYAFGGNLRLPILAHFVNNGFTLVLIYLYHRDILKYNFEDNAALPLPYTLAAAACSIALIWLLTKYLPKNHLNIHKTN